MAEEVLANLWARRLIWSAAADKAGDRIATARMMTLSLSVVGALLETMAATIFEDAPGVRTTAAGGGAVMLALATYFTLQLVNPETLKAWTTLRAVSEALKAEIFAFRASAGFYASEDRLQKLTERAEEIRRPAADYESFTTGVVPRASPLPPELDRNGYIAQRVHDQIEKFYRPKAAEFAVKASRFRLATLLLGAASTALATVATGLSAGQSAGTESLDVAAWVAVLTTLSGALSAHVSASRYEFLINNYLSTASHLEGLLNRWRADRAQDAAAWDAFVRQVEEALAMQNQSWVAKLASLSATE